MANPNPSPKHRFKPGRSGNPGGRQPGPSVATFLRRMLERIDPKSGKSYAYVLCEALFMAAIKGNIQAARFLIERVDGKPPRRIEITHRYPELDDRLRRGLEVAYGPRWGDVDFTGLTDEELRAVAAGNVVAPVAGKVGPEPKPDLRVVVPPASAAGA